MTNICSKLCVDKIIRIQRLNIKSIFKKLKKIHEEERIPSYKNLKKYLKYITIQKIKIKIEIEIKIKIKIHDKYNIIVLSMNDIMICT